jgi:hypothetical protein
MTDKLSLIESIVNENAVNFRDIVGKVLLEKLSVRLDEEYKLNAKHMFTLSEAEETEEELEETDEEGDEEGDEDEEEMDVMPDQAASMNSVARSYGAY